MPTVGYHHERQEVRDLCDLCHRFANGFVAQIQLEQTYGLPAFCYRGQHAPPV